jgi:N-formylglutamate amidohydrolase
LNLSVVLLDCHAIASAAARCSNKNKPVCFFYA